MSVSITQGFVTTCDQVTVGVVAVDILLVAQDRPKVYHLSRDPKGWRTTTHGHCAIIEIPHLQCMLTLPDVYVNINV